MTQPAPFTTAYAVPFTPALALAVSASDVLEFHRPTFLGARMDAEGGTGGDGPNGGPQGGDGGTGGQGGTDLGFPENTPWREMKPEEQVLYWQHKARKHESEAKNRSDYDAIKAERDRLIEEHATDAEKAASAARKEGETAAATRYQARLVQAELKAELKGILPDDQLASHVEFLDASKFLTSDGEVDADKVTKYAASVPRGGAGNTQQTWPDTGGGHRDTGGGKNKADAGRAEAERRFGKKTA